MTDLAHWGIYRYGLCYRACDLTNPDGLMQVALDAVTCPDCRAVIDAGSAA